MAHLRLEGHEADYDREKGHTLDQSGDDNHVGTDLTGGIRLTAYGLHGRRTDLSDTDTCAYRSESGAYGGSEYC
jgi:hypothetical protein